MKQGKLWLPLALAGLLLGGGAGAQDPERDRLRARDPDRMQRLDADRERSQKQLRDRDIYGYQLMSPEERDAYRAQMRGARTQEEREHIRAEHHERMQARARERGLELPDEPRYGSPGMHDRPGRRAPGMGGGRGGR